MLWESIKMAWVALTANTMRAVLTTLSVAIGIMFVLLMGWALSGLDNVLEQTLSMFGDDVLYVDKFSWAGGGNWQAARNRKNITYEQYLRVRQLMRNAQYVVPTTRTFSGKVQHGDDILSTAMVFGTNAEYIYTLGESINQGRFFTEDEDASGMRVAILGSEVVEKLFPDRQALGRTIKVEGIPFIVVGTMSKRGSMMNDMIDRQVTIPIKRYFSIYGNNGLFSRVVINVKAGGKENLENVKYETIGVMRQVRSLPPGTEDDFSVNEQDQFRQQADIFRYVFWAVGLLMTGLSFLVGSIGIMNIMFVSVTERTREIGIRKAIGARRSGILIQFLTEAVFLCLTGAIFGFVITILIIATVPILGDAGVLSEGLVEFLPSTLPLSLIAIAVIVSVVVGVLAGIIPAFRAARLNPVDALRSE